jgi:hypothetical protein
MNSNRQLAGILFATAVLLGCSAGVRGEPPEAAELIRRHDRDADGKLDRDELREALSRLFPSTPKFIRIERNAQGIPQSLDTSVATYRTRDGRLQVDLIGAVHVADQSYYEKLNEQFQHYDAVLYELVAPEGTRVPAGGAKSQHPVGRMQEAIKDLLDLSYQLNHINYGAANLIHADMSPDEFARSMEERGESFLQILFRMLGQAAAQSGRTNQVSDTDLLFAFFSSDRALKLKRVMAAQFEDLDGQMQILDGPEGSTLISQRNKKVLEVLRREIDRGRTKLAIFYGAGHMPDIARRLETEWEMQLASEQWLTAWDMSGKKTAKP